MKLSLSSLLNLRLGRVEIDLDRERVILRFISNYFEYCDVKVKKDCDDTETEHIPVDSLCSIRSNS